MTTDLRFPLLAVGFVGVLTAMRLTAWPLTRVESPSSRDLASGQSVAETVGRIAPESAATIVSRDPFRVERRPVLPAYDPLRLAEQLAPPPPRPALILAGVVDGVEPSAIIEGLPGIEGSRVVRIGDVVAGLQIKQIAHGRVVIAGIDTTWVLEVREPWEN